MLLKIAATHIGAMTRRAQRQQMHLQIAELFHHGLAVNIYAQP